MSLSGGFSTGAQLTTMSANPATKSAGKADQDLEMFIRHRQTDALRAFSLRFESRSAASWDPASRISFEGPNIGDLGDGSGIAFDRIVIRIAQHVDLLGHEFDGYLRFSPGHRDVTMSANTRGEGRLQTFTGLFASVDLARNPS